MDNQIDKAIDLMGGTNQVVRKLKLNGHATVYQWRVQKRVPAKYCPLIEEETGIQCEYLNDEVPWHVLRGTAERQAANA